MQECPKEVLVKSLIGNNDWALNEQNYVELGLKITQYSNNIIAPLNIKELIEFCNYEAEARILLIGRAGCGKSLLLRYICTVFKQTTFEIIVLVPLASLILAHSQATLIELLHFYRFAGEELTAETRIQLEEIIATKKILWLIDEWDEIDDRAKLSSAAIKKLLSVPYLILASRFTESRHFIPDHIATIEDMDLLSKLDYIEKFGGIKELLEYFEQIKNCCIAEVELIILLWKGQKLGPLVEFDRHSLMQRSVAYTFENYFAKMPDLKLSNNDFYCKQFIPMCHRHLAFMAFDKGQKRFFNENTALLACQQVIKKIRETLKNMHFIEDDIICYVRQFLENVTDFGFIERIMAIGSTAPFAYAFKHIVFQEFFAGEFVHNELLTADVSTT